MNDFFPRWALVAGLMLPLAAHAATVTGTVTDKTTGRPDTSDPVVLLSLSQGMQEVASTKPNAQGHFSLKVPDNNMHLIRVTHQQASYYESVPPGTTHVNVTVYDVQKRVSGVTTSADVMRMQTDSQGLHVMENYFVENKSKPPKTQFGSNPFPIYLPANAQLEGAQAEGSAGMPVSISPVPLSGKGHYALVFPIRPGETRFGVSYLIPNYSGSFNFSTRVSFPTGDLAVMLPNSMSFQSSGSGFQQIQDKQVKAQTFVARNVKPGQKVSFTVSGTGSMPREMQAQSGSQTQTQAQAGQAAAGGQPQTGRPGGGLGKPIGTPGPLDKYRWWILSGLGLLLVVVAAFLLGGKKNVERTQMEREENPLTPTVAPGKLAPRTEAPGTGAPGTETPPTRTETPGTKTPGTGASGTVVSGGGAGAPPAKAGSGSSTASEKQAPSSSALPSGPPRNTHVAEAAPSNLLQVLKEELFTVETERVEGKLTEAQYAEVRGALEVVLRRALRRKG